MVRRDRVRRPRRKVCQCCVDHIDTVDYKDVAALRRFVSERGKILPRRVTGTQSISVRLFSQSREQELSHCFHSAQTNKDNKSSRDRLSLELFVCIDMMIGIV